MRKSWLTALLTIICVGLISWQVLANRKVEADCTIKGFKLYGKIQVVTSFPDLKVQVVNSFPDRCGTWQFVNSFPDLKIQYVNSFPDLKIQYVNSFPGRP